MDHALHVKPTISNVPGGLIRLVSFVREWKLQCLPCYYINFSAQLAPSRSDNSYVVSRVQLGAEATVYIALLGRNLEVIRAHVHPHGFAYVVYEPDLPLARLQWLAAGAR